MAVVEGPNFGPSTILLLGYVIAGGSHAADAAQDYVGEE